MNRYGYDGQLGCAAITLGDNSSPNEASPVERDTMARLEKWLLESKSALPSYAVPRFVRVLVNEGPALDQGGSSGDSGSERVSVIMKKLKTGLRKDGECPCLEDSLLKYGTDILTWNSFPQALLYRKGTGIECIG